MKKTYTKKNTKEIYRYAPINKRGFAFVLDWYLGSAFCTIPVGLLWNKLTNETTINTDLSLFESPYGLLAGLLGLLFGAVYFYLIPLAVWEGQTLGKKLFGVRIVAEDGTKLPAGRLAFRQLVGIILLEGTYMMTGDLIVQMISILMGETVGKVFSYVTVALFIGSIILTVKNNKAIHDFLAHSIVIENNKI